MVAVFLLLGTNIGDLKENLRRALEALEEGGLVILKKSRIYRTKPWGNEEQPDFLNMVVQTQCAYSPLELLVKIKDIEQQLGRKPNRRWGPRVMDIDILFYGKQIIQETNLTIPHPEFFRRPFAIQLMAEVAPDFIPPHSSRPIRDYLGEKNNEEPAVYCN